MPGKNILIISTSDFVGGGETFIYNTLSQLPYNLTFLVASEKLKDLLKSRGCNVVTFNSESFIKRISEVKRLIGSSHYDTVIFNGGNAIYLSIFVHAPNKILYRHSTYEAYRSGIKRFAAKCLTELSVLRSDRIVHVSKYSYNQQLLQKCKGTVIYHYVKVHDGAPKHAAETFKALYVGRLEPAKGIDIITDAFCSSSLSDCDLTIVGAGVLENRIRLLPNRNIHFIGYSEHPEDYYKKADVFITLPQFEAFGLTILEAMSNGVPVITTKCGGITEIVKNNLNGLFVQRNIHSVIDAINLLHQDKNLRDKLSLGALETAANFKFENTIARICEII